MLKTNELHRFYIPKKLCQFHLLSTSTQLMSFHQNSSHWVPGLLSFKPLSLSFFTTFQLHCHPPKPPCQLPRRLSPATAAAARCGAWHWPQRRRRQRPRRPELWSVRRRMGWQVFDGYLPSSRNAIISLRLHFLALLFNNSNNNNNNNNSNNNHNLGKICIPPNLECKKNRSVSGAKHGAFHCSPHSQKNLQPKWESQICCFRSSFSIPSHLSSQLHMSTGSHGAQPTISDMKGWFTQLSFFRPPKNLPKPGSSCASWPFPWQLWLLHQPPGEKVVFWYRSLFLGLTWDIQKMKDPKSDCYLSSDGKMSLSIFWGKHQKYASWRHKIRHTSTHHLAPMTFSPVSPEKNWSPLLLAETSSRLLVLRPAWLLAVA